MSRVWDQYVSAEELRAPHGRGFGAAVEPGGRPVLMDKAFAGGSMKLTRYGGIARGACLTARTTSRGAL